MGVVKSALAVSRLSRGDDADFFFAIFFLDGMNYQQNNSATSQADCMPAFLAFHHSLHIRDGRWIFEHTHCQLE